MSLNPTQGCVKIMARSKWCYVSSDIGYFLLALLCVVLVRICSFFRPFSHTLLQGGGLSPFLLWECVCLKTQFSRRTRRGGIQEADEIK